MANLSKVRTLSIKEWGYLISALLLLPTLQLALRVWGMRRVCRLLLRISPSIPADRSSAPADKESASLVRMVDIAATHGVVRASCLLRSLAIWWWLRWRGVESQLRIGVNRQGAELRAHAWVEAGGALINDNPRVVQGFAPFERVIIQTASTSVMHGVVHVDS